MYQQLHQNLQAVLPKLSQQLQHLVYQTQQSKLHKVKNGKVVLVKLGKLEHQIKFGGIQIIQVNHFRVKKLLKKHIMQGCNKDKLHNLLVVLQKHNQLQQKL